MSKSSTFYGQYYIRQAYLFVFGNLQLQHRLIHVLHLLSSSSQYLSDQFSCQIYVHTANCAMNQVCRSQIFFSILLISFSNPEIPNRLRYYIDFYCPLTGSLSELQLRFKYAFYFILHNIIYIYIQFTIFVLDQQLTKTIIVLHSGFFRDLRYLLFI